MNIIFWLSLLFVVIVLISQSKERNRGKEHFKSIKKEFLLLKKEVLASAGANIPGATETLFLGHVKGISTTTAITKEDTAQAEQEALYELLKEAKAAGANAVVDMRLISSTTCLSTYTGTAVKIAMG